MKSQRVNIEMIAPSVEEAIQNGLAELGLPEEAVEIEVLDEGSRGIFGIGTRQARVRLSVKEEESQEISPSVATPASADEQVEMRSSIAAATQTPISLKDDIALHVARETVSELLDRMNIKAQVTTRLGEMDEQDETISIYVDIHGPDLSMLIGRRSETLNALQYISRLIVNKELGRSVNLVIDVEGFRLRRDRQLRMLAQRMADQAIKTGKRQMLEPMPANERRIIHMELRNHTRVVTESIGEEPHRKVTIIPKE
jgi:spoIIIJ-associated protein